MMTPSASDPGWPCVSACALPEWIDDMGHVNMQQYFRLAAQGVFGMTLKILCGGRTPEPPPLVFTLEADMQYRSEILSGQEIEVYMLPISRGGKVMRSMIRIYKMTPQPALAAECDWTGAYINRETRKIDPLPPLAMEIWDRKVGELGAALPDPDAAPRRKGFSPAAPSEDHGRRTLEGQIEAGWIDRMGHMGIEHYALIFERASRKYLESLGFDLARERERGLGAFGLSTRVKYLKELKLGEAFEVRTRMAGTGRKSVTYRHELLRADAPPGKDPTLTESLCAVCDQTTAFVDLSTRRAIELPMKLMGDQIGK